MPGPRRSPAPRAARSPSPTAVGFVWAFAASTNSTHARVHYAHRREHGDRHTSALRNLFNKLIGCLHHCLITVKQFDPAAAFPNITLPETGEEIAAAA